MRALLLAAGFGTRLRPLTNTIPKCLVPIKGEPLLGIWLQRLSANGLGPFLVNTHYLSDRVTDYLQSSPYRDQVTVVHEEHLLGTAGTLAANISFFDEREGLLIHADNYCLADFGAFVQSHKNRPADCVMTMMTFRTNEPSSCGIVELDERGVVQGFHEKQPQPPGNLANGAIYALGSEMLTLMKTEFARASDFSTEVLPHLLGRIHTYETPEKLVDIGTPERLRALDA